MRRLLASLCLLPAAACGEIKTVPAGDGGAGAADAAADADPGNPADPLIGEWAFTIDEPPDGECTVTIGDGTYEVYCPSDPVEVATDCMRTKNDTRITGSWTGAFAGTFDEIERYEGAGCSAAGYGTVGADIVSEGILQMEADHAEVSEQPGFLRLAHGMWSWSLWEPAMPADGIDCDVTFAPGADDDTVSFEVECAEPPSTPEADCTLTEVVVLHGTLTADQMTAEGWDEDRYVGTGCTMGPVVESAHTPMQASKL